MKPLPARRLLGGLTGLLLVAPLAPSALDAQNERALEVAGTVQLVDHRHDLPDVGSRTLRGTAWGALGTVRAQWLELRAEYAEGTLTVEGQPDATTTVVEGSARLGVRLAPWLIVHVGPRAYELAGAVSRRIVSWQLGTQVSFTLIPGLARGFGGGATHLGGSADSRTSLGGGATGEVGLRLETPALPLWASGSYRVESDAVTAAPGSDIAQRLLIAFGLRF